MHTKNEVTRFFITCLDLTVAEIVGLHEQMSENDLGSFKMGELRGEGIAMKAAIGHSQIREWECSFTSNWKTLTTGRMISSHTRRLLDHCAAPLGP